MRIGFIVFFFIIFLQLKAQQSPVATPMHTTGEDTSFNTNKVLDEVVITATRTENRVSNIPLPIHVINAGSIQQSGAQRLIDVLQMQTGLMIASNPLGTALKGYPNPFGDGIQMQGLDPAYTLILIDGEPVTGRNAGIINLDRIAVGNIKQIEILKGPATSLYGSDALAGVINIISADPRKNDFSFQTHYSTNNTLGLSGTANLKAKKAAYQLFAKRYSSDGYDFDKDLYGQTVDPFTNYSVNGKMIYDFNERSNLLTSLRYNSSNQKNAYLIYPDDQVVAVGGHTIEEDKSAFIRYKNHPGDALSYIAQVYATNYSNNANVYIEKDGSLFDHIGLSQTLIKPEFQINLGRDPLSLGILGVGYNWEKISSTRYNGDHQLNAFYILGQKQWVINSTNIIVGGRYEKNVLYKAQFNPKLSVAHKFTPDFILKASIGTGFKTPDFRQQFLSFDNTMVNYFIVGAKELTNVLQEQIRRGLLDDNEEVRAFMVTNELIPEKSIGMNLGLDYTLKQNTVFKLNLFRNDITHLIESYSLPLVTKNGTGFFSYKNVNKVFTEGAEFSINHRFNRFFTINGAYQYLIAKDKEIINQIKNGEIYKRDPSTNVSSPVRLSDYHGLFNRSKHSGNLSIRYFNDRLKGGAMVLAKYRGSFGYFGLNGFNDGNNILDDDREFIKEFTLLNISVNKNLGKYFDLQAGIENLLNYTNKVYMPNIFGRVYFINLNFKL